MRVIVCAYLLLCSDVFLDEVGGCYFIYKTWLQYPDLSTKPLAELLRVTDSRLKYGGEDGKSLWMGMLDKDKNRRRDQKKGKRKQSRGREKKQIKIFTNQSMVISTAEHTHHHPLAAEAIQQSPPLQQRSKGRQAEQSRAAKSGNFPRAYTPRG